jgi:hemerythrin superfamily protein
LVSVHNNWSVAMDLWQMIANDHANIADLCGEIPRAFPDGVRSRERLFSELDTVLRRHLEAEEESLYDALEDHDRAERLVAELEHEHEEIERLLSELARMRDKGTQDWTHRFRDLAALVEGHFHREEQELLPLAREILDEEELRELRHEYVEENIEALRARRAAGMCHQVCCWEPWSEPRRARSPLRPGAAAHWVGSQSGPRRSFSCREHLCLAGSVVSWAAARDGDGGRRRPMCSGTSRSARAPRSRTSHPGCACPSERPMPSWPTSSGEGWCAPPGTRGRSASASW